MQEQLLQGQEAPGSWPTELGAVWGDLGLAWALAGLGSFSE